MNGRAAIALVSPSLFRLHRSAFSSSSLSSHQRAVVSIDQHGAGVAIEPVFLAALAAELPAGDLRVVEAETLALEGRQIKQNQPELRLGILLRVTADDWHDVLPSRVLRH